MLLQPNLRRNHAATVRLYPIVARSCRRLNGLQSWRASCGTSKSQPTFTITPDTANEPAGLGLLPKASHRLEFSHYCFALTTAPAFLNTSCAIAMYGGGCWSVRLGIFYPLSGNNSSAGRGFHSVSMTDL